MSKNNQLSERDVRIQKIEKMKKMGIKPYAQSFDKKNLVSDIISEYGDKTHRDINDIIEKPEVQVSTAGRITLYRSHGKLAFAKIMDSTSTIQLMFHRDQCHIDISQSQNKPELKDILTGEWIWADGWNEMTAYKFMEKMVDVWDFVWVRWEVFTTHKWELTIFVSEFKFLSKAVRPLPEKFHWLTDQEELYRKRYLDMIANPDTYKRFMFKSDFYKTLRDFYHEEWFTEITTPILGNAASWAAAKPFITHHNDFDVDFYLRIAFETALKKATVWGMEKVFEIGKDFRNEWSDPSHLQEFTQTEHYAAYRNYEDNMKFTEKMFDYIFDKLSWYDLWDKKLSKKIDVKNKDGEVKTVDFSTPWERIDYTKWVSDASWIDISIYWNEDADKLRADIKAKWIQFDRMDDMWTTTLIDYLYKKVLRPDILWPAFIYNYPVIMQPLARVSDDNAGVVEQFQLLVNGREICKAYSELVDPIFQQANFDLQSEAAAAGDEEATAEDTDFVTAMEYGMPPQSGFGMWLERILAILTEQDNLRDVVMFPIMKPENNNNSDNNSEESEVKK